LSRRRSSRSSSSRTINPRLPTCSTTRHRRGITTSTGVR
jgi:hypothetical protein